MSRPVNYGELYRAGKKILEQADIGEAALDARLLLESVCRTNRNDLLVHGDREVEPEKEKKYLAFIEKRASHMPLQYITGVQEFMGLEFTVNEKVLIPRQDTEILVEEVLRDLHDGSRILDMCTGSGCILISLLHYSNDCQGTGADISGDALCVARENAARILAGKKDDTVARFVESDLFERVEGRFDILVSNPPYIRSAVIPELAEEVRGNEPILALDGAEDGLLFYRRIIKQGKEHLCGGGRLFFEIGYDQGVAVKGMMEEAGYADVRIVKDFSGLDRVVYGRYEVRE